jgi:hypothetical protein
MALPKIDLPIFDLTLPSTGEKIKYRPFTVKEEKILLVAQEAADPRQEMLAAKQIINNCLIDGNIEDLAMFDAEYILINLRGKSVENTAAFTIKDPDTEEEVQLELDIDAIKIKKNDEHTNKIRINDEYVLFLKYPTINEFIKMFDYAPNDPLADYFIMVSCLDSIASEDEVHKFTDYTQEEIDSFMDDMSADVIKQIQTFFETMPRLRQELKYTNTNDEEKTFVIEGMRSFFI